MYLNLDESFVTRAVENNKYFPAQSEDATPRPKQSDNPRHQD